MHFLLLMFALSEQKKPLISLFFFLFPFCTSYVNCLDCNVVAWFCFVVCCCFFPWTIQQSSNFISQKASEVQDRQHKTREKHHHKTFFFVFFDLFLAVYSQSVFSDPTSSPLSKTTPFSLHFTFYLSPQKKTATTLRNRSYYSLSVSLQQYVLFRNKHTKKKSNGH